MNTSATVASVSSTSTISNASTTDSVQTCSICFESFHNINDGLKCSTLTHFICSEDFNKVCLIEFNI